jgi:hypothetical protein
MNIGVLPSGACALIDVESFYLQESGGFNVSVPAWKPFRAPLNLKDSVQEQLMSGRINPETAVRKQRYEIALAAAECVLGPLNIGRDNINAKTLQSWLSGADPHDPAVQFWAKVLPSSVEDGEFRPLSELYEELKTAIDGAQPPVAHAPLAHQPAPQVVAQPGGMSESVPHEGVPSIEDWQDHWAALKPAAYALRAGKLTGPQVLEYRATLELFAHKYPLQREFWNELLLVVISYEKDAVGAFRYVNEAHEHLPHDPDLNRMRNIVQRWNYGAT